MIRMFVTHMARSSHCDVQANMFIFIGLDSRELFPHLGTPSGVIQGTCELLQDRRYLLTPLGGVPTPACDCGVLTLELVLF